MNDITAILLSGGIGSRMQESTPKQYLLLAGKPMIMHSIERLDRIDSIKNIIIVCDASYIKTMTEMLQEYNISKPVEFAPAGQTRQESVLNGLMSTESEFVIIHEAARPFVRTSDFSDIINDEADNVTFGYDIPFTVLRGHSQIEGLLSRSELINIQLPQKFRRYNLLDAHQKARQEGNIYTEDASLLFSETGTPVKILKGNGYNLKITEPIDLLYGEIIYKTYISNRR